ncbi:MAG: hypothetical protein ACREPM_04750, partial [Gemmatimonadaceae bacterium]
MTDHDSDPLVQRAVDELRRLPPLDRAAVRRIAGVAAAARLSPAGDDLAIRSRPRVRWWVTIGMAAAAAAVGFVARDLIPSNRAATDLLPVASVPVRAAVATTEDVVRVPE